MDKGAPIDTGISYNGSTNAVQKLLDKMKKPSGFKNKPTDQGADKEDLSSMNAILDHLIEFGYSTQYPKSVIESVWRKLKPKPKLFKSTEARIKKANPIKGNGQAPKNLFSLLDDLVKFSRGDQINKNLFKYIHKRNPNNPLTAFLSALEIKPGAIKVPPRKPIKLRKLEHKLDDLIQFQDTRPRNPLGEFSPQSEEGPSPNSMAVVYKQGQAGGQTEGGVLHNLLSKIKGSGKKLARKL